MTPKETAEELYYRFTIYAPLHIDNKECALIAVNYIINSNPHSNPFNTEVYSTFNYWIEVKKEIENL